MEKIRKLIFFKRYFQEFFDQQTDRVKEKFDYVFYLITIAERIPNKFFRRIIGTDGLYEIRIEFESNIFRVFCCFDEGSIIVLFNGFQKKSKKAPEKEIKKALKIKDEYFRMKKEGIL